MSLGESFHFSAGVSAVFPVPCGTWIRIYIQLVVVSAGLKGICRPGRP